jgi:hypothetical protein
MHDQYCGHDMTLALHTQVGSSGSRTTTGYERDTNKEVMSCWDATEDAQRYAQPKE